MRITSKRISAALLACVALTTFSGVQAAFDEHLDNYQLDTKVVKGDRSKDQFGNTVTEQSYYRTGGDVKVITRDEIENVITLINRSDQTYSRGYIPKSRIPWWGIWVPVFQ